MRTPKKSAVLMNLLVIAVPPERRLKSPKLVPALFLSRIELHQLSNAKFCPWLNLWARLPHVSLGSVADVSATYPIVCFVPVPDIQSKPLRA
jgi:hypothetical protein